MEADINYLLKGYKAWPQKKSANWTAYETKTPALQF